MKLGVSVTWSSKRPDILPGIPFSHFQSSAYHNLLLGYHQTPRWMLAKRSDEVIATWLFFETPGEYLSPAKNRILRRLDCHVKTIHGPVFAESLSRSERMALIRIMLGKLKSWLFLKAPLSLSIQLEPGLDDDMLNFWEESALEENFSVKEGFTYAIELPKDEVELASLIKSDRRTKVRKAEKSGLTFCEGSGMADLEKYYQVRRETMQRNQLSVVDWEHFATTFNLLEGTGIYRVFLAIRESQVEAGQVAFVWNGYVYLSGVSMSDRSIAEKIPANDFLQWHLLHWNLRSGNRFVDFVGANPGSTCEKIQAIDAFKARWGTQLYRTLEISLKGASLRRVPFALANRLVSAWEGRAT